MYKANSRARDKPRPSGFRMLGTGSLALERKVMLWWGMLNVNALVGISGQKWEGGIDIQGMLMTTGRNVRNLCGHTRGWL